MFFQRSLIFNSLYLIYIKIVKNYFNNFLANGILQIARFLILFLFARFNSPSDFGILSILLLIANYNVNVNLGAINGLKRQLPLKYIRYNSVELNEINASIFTFNLLMTIISASIIIVFISDFVSGLSIYDKFNFLIYTISFNVFFFFQTLTISFGDFRYLKKIHYYNSLLLIICISFTFFSRTFFFAALALSYLLLNIKIFKQKYDYRLIIKKNHVTENMKIGLPIMIGGFVFLFFQSLDRIFVSKYFPSILLGYYSFAWLLVSSMNLIINLSNDILLQKGARRYSEKENRIMLFKYIHKYMFMMYAIIFFLSIILFFVSGPLINIYYPKYIGSIIILKYLLVSLLIQQLFSGIVNYLYLINKQKSYLLSITLSLLLEVAIFFTVTNLKFNYLIYVKTFIIANLIYSFFLTYLVREEILVILKSFFLRDVNEYNG